MVERKSQTTSDERSYRHLSPFQTAFAFSDKTADQAVHGTGKIQNYKVRIRENKENFLLIS